MAKPNVNTASRAELLGAGVRAETIDAIMKWRRRKAGISLDMLGELPGIGPATLEKLRDALEFGPAGGVPAERKPRRRQRAAAPAPEQVTDVAEAALDAGTEQAAELVAAATHGDAEAARSAPRIVHATLEASGLAASRQASSSMHELNPRAAPAEPRRPHADAVGIGARLSFARMLAEVLQEQGEENAEAMQALARAEQVGDVLRLQGEYLRHTFERMANLNRRWLDLAAKTWPNDQT